MGVKSLSLVWRGRPGLKPLMVFGVFAGLKPYAPTQNWMASTFLAAF
jgi:hypothetical protein